MMREFLRLFGTIGDSCGTLRLVQFFCGSETTIAKSAFFKTKVTAAISATVSFSFQYQRFIRNAETSLIGTPRQCVEKRRTSG